jgi:hypothetical protein
MSSSPKGCPFRFPDWLPPLARQRITELLATPLGEGDFGRAMLARLATTYPAMKTEVWEKLPCEPRGIEGNIIDWTFFAFTIFPSLRRPYPKTKDKWREWTKHRELHLPLADPANLSELSNWLWEEIFKLKDVSDSYWPSLWEGDKSISPDQVLSILDHLRMFYARMDGEYRALLTMLPKVNRWNAKAAQKFFTEYLSCRMRETYAQPLDSIVATLAEVAFNLPQGLAAETVRGRRRIGSGPENSKRKLR